MPPDTSPSLEVPPTKLSGEAALEPGESNQTSSKLKDSLPRETSGSSRVKFSKAESSNSSTIHPVRIEDENLDYDSNASSSSFEFHKGERSGHHPISRSLSRPVPSKWNDAEKWIVSRQNVQASYHKKNSFQNQANRFPMTLVKVAPEYADYDNKLSTSRMVDTKRVDFCQPASQMGFDKFSFPTGSHPISGQACVGNALVNTSSQSKDLKEVGQRDLTCSTASEEMAGNMLSK